MNLYNRLIADQFFLDNTVITIHSTQGLNRMAFVTEWQNFDVYGYLQPHEQYSAVLYIGNKITVKRVGLFEDAISTGFSGCYMAVFLYHRDRYVAHIPPNYLRDWNKFINQSCVQSVYEFNPMRLLNINQAPAGQYPANRIYGIIDQNNQVYSLEIFDNIKFDNIDRRYKLQGNCRIVQAVDGSTLGQRYKIK